MQPELTFAAVRLVEVSFYDATKARRTLVATVKRSIFDVELIQHSHNGSAIGRTLVRSRLEKHGGSNTAHGAGRGAQTAQPVHGLDFAGSGTIRNEPAPTAR